MSNQTFRRPPPDVRTVADIERVLGKLQRIGNFVSEMVGPQAPEDQGAMPLQLSIALHRVNREAAQRELFYAGALLQRLANYLQGDQL